MVRPARAKTSSRSAELSQPLQASPKHIQQIAAISQRDRQHSIEVAHQHMITRDAFEQSKASQQLGGNGIGVRTRTGSGVWEMIFFHLC
ncbi:hypothetical protein CQZ98_28705 [Pseudomonas sp. MYb115]|nr:hypothetical protein CQZ98_28705 [Pseudomonas sp. MYb115]